MRTAKVMLFVPLCCALAALVAAAPQDDPRGLYFAKKAYAPQPLPTFDQTKDKLPDPIYDERPIWIKTYWKAWELAFRNFHEPAAGSGFVSQFIDAAFNQNAFLWDTCFMTMFCNYAHPLVPGISSLDNFYARQHADGEVCREIRRADGADYEQWVNDTGGPLFSRWGWNLSGADTRRVSRPVQYVGRAAPSPNPKLTLDALNHPIFAWAELESYRMTGDRARLALVWEPLEKYYDALRTYLLQGNGLYITDWASMDNSPRNVYLIDGGTGVDISSEMVLFARHMAEIGGILGKRDAAAQFAREADALAALIREKMWDPARRFYFDLTLKGERAPVKTIAAYWTMLAKVASAPQAEALVAELKNPETFGRFHPVPTCSAAENGYTSEGGYWRGAVWTPATTMVVRGLEAFGYGDFGRELALKHLGIVAEVFEKTGTIWENYAPDTAAPGKPARRDFVGWSGLAPIMYLLEYAIGLHADAPRNELLWELRSNGRVGCRRFRFGGHVVSVEAEPGANRRKITVDSDGSFRLRVIAGGKETVYAITKGRKQFTLR